MKKTLFLCLQFVLFLIVLVAGSFFPPFHMEHVVASTPTTSHIFVADGLVLMLGLYLLIVVVEVVMKRVRTTLPWTTIALVLAAILGLRFGFKTIGL